MNLNSGIVRDGHLRPTDESEPDDYQDDEVCEECRLLKCVCDELEAAMLATAHIMPSINELRRQMEEATSKIIANLEGGADQASQDCKESVEPTIPLDQLEEAERIKKARNLAA